MSVQPSTVYLQALYLGARIDTRELEKRDAVLRSPLMLRVGGQGYAVIFRFGAVVCVNMSDIERDALLQSLRSNITRPIAEPAVESLEARTGDSDHLDADGRLYIREITPERLQVIAAVLAKSTALAHYEFALSQVFDRIDRIADNLRDGGKHIRDRELLREIGDVLGTQSKMVGRVEVAEKPEITWDYPELDRLYGKLAVEYELRDRDLALSRKLEVVSDTAHTQLELLHNRRTLRVEWYIVILIVFEIVLTLTEKFSS